MLAWVFRRCEGTAGGGGDAGRRRAAPEDAIETEGLDVSPSSSQSSCTSTPRSWRKELPAIQEHFARFGDRLPEELRKQLDELEQRLKSG